MAADKVYLDHLVARENLRYTALGFVGKPIGKPSSQDLRLSDLYGTHPSSLAGFLRKPDFQRATSAWTPEQCVSLLESIVHRQVVPSIIMWSSSENPYTYILDGAHRVSVVIAWLMDDWGEGYLRAVLQDGNQPYADPAEAADVQEAARKVRALVQAKIGAFSDFQAAGDEQVRLVEEGRVVPAQEMGAQRMARAGFYNELRRGDIVFRTQYVTGNYDVAEQSFLKINKSGTELTQWETILIENRNSSFARAVMAISYANSAAHYWPRGEDPNQATPTGGLVGRVERILAGVRSLHDILFTPPFRTPLRTLRQPLLVPPDSETKPVWVAELLTVIVGKRGQYAETLALMQTDRDSSPDRILDSGERLVQDAVESFAHLVGPSPVSLALVPALYFYTDTGRYVRSLLYGLIYWLCRGSSDEILTRKRLFCAHRAAFERFLLDKEDSVTGITRKTGSGPEITLQTTRYFQGLLELLIAHDDEIEGEAFRHAYAELVGALTNGAKKAVGGNPGGLSRTFTRAQRSGAVLNALFSGAATCPICDGMMDPAWSEQLQHDHALPFAQGGRTVPDNQRLTHPFCNNQRTVIEDLRTKRSSLALPSLPVMEGEGQPLQLVLFGQEAFR